LRRVKQHSIPGYVIFGRLGKRKGLEIVFLLGILFVVSIIGFINFSSLLSFFIFFFLTVFVYRILFGKDVQRVAGLFVFYSGFSGPPGGIGTDDSKFYYEAIHGIAVSPELIIYSEGSIHSFSKILRLVVRILPFENVHLLDLLFFNILGISFIPIFTYHLAYKLTQERKTSYLAYKFVVICPIIMTNGLILIRDGWSAVLFVGAIYFLLVNRYFLMVGAVILLSYIRLASGLQLVMALLIFFYYRFRNYHGYYAKKVIIVMISIAFVAILAVALLPIVTEYLQKKGLLIAGSFLFRQTFVEGFMAEGLARSNKFSIFFLISSQPFYLRIPLGFLFFLGAPFLSIQNLSYAGIYIPRAFLGQIFFVLFPFYLKYLIQGTWYAWKRKEMSIKLTAFTLFFLLLALSQLSLQGRHKTMVMPLFYILAAYGFYHKTKISAQLGILAAVVVVGIQIAAVMWRMA